MPRWYYGWNVVATGMTFQAIAFGLTVYAFGLWVTPLGETFGASRAEVMVGFTLLSVVMGVLSPFAGRAMDRRSIRNLVTAGACCMAAGFLLASFAQSTWQFIAAYTVLIAVGMLLAGPLAASTLAAKWFTTRRGLAIGLSAVGTSVGGMLLPPLAAALLVDFGMGWRGAHQVLALIVLIAVVPLVRLVVANSPEEKGVDPEPDGFPTGAGTTHQTQWRYGELLRDRTFWTTVFAFGFLSMVFGGVQSNLIPYAQDRGLSASSAAALMSVLAAAGILGKIIYGNLADRISHRVLFWSATAIMAVPLVLMMGSPDYLVLVAISLALGFTTGAFLPLTGAIIGNRFGPFSFGQVMGLLGPFTMPLAIVGPPLSGYIFDQTGSYDLALQIFLGVTVVSCVAMAFLDESPRPYAPTVT